MRRLTLFLVSLAVAVGLSASVATANTCACGNGGYPILVGNAYGICTYDYGPGASPRYTSRPC
jgi:hypothetical protein